MGSEPEKERHLGAMKSKAIHYMERYGSQASKKTGKSRKPTESKKSAMIDALTNKKDKKNRHKKAEQKEYLRLIELQIAMNEEGRTR